MNEGCLRPKNASKFIGRLSWQAVLSEKIIHFRWLTIL